MCIQILYSINSSSVKLDNSKLGSTQQQKIWWHWHVARIISSQKIYGLYARKHHIIEMRGDVTDAGRQTTNERTTTEDRATQPMEAGGWVSQFLEYVILFSVVQIVSMCIKENIEGFDDGDWGWQMAMSWVFVFSGILILFTFKIGKWGKPNLFVWIRLEPTGSRLFF